MRSIVLNWSATRRFEHHKRGGETYEGESRSIGDSATRDKLTTISPQRRNSGRDGHGKRRDNESRWEKHLWGIKPRERCSSFKSGGANRLASDHMDLLSGCRCSQSVPPAPFESGLLDPDSERLCSRRSCDAAKCQTELYSWELTSSNLPP